MSTQSKNSSAKQAQEPLTALAPVTTNETDGSGRLSLQRLAQIVSACSYIRLSPDTQRLVPVGGPTEAVAPVLYGELRNQAAGPKLQSWSTQTKNSYTAGRDPDGQPTDCVLLNSVAAEANAMEAGLLAARARGSEVPDLLIDFSVDLRTEHLGSIGTLEAPHRGYDALFRDSLLHSVAFIETDEGKALINARPAKATALLSLPHMALLGAWHSQGVGGGSGAKFGRVLKSEITAYGAVPSDIAASRIDPLAIARAVPIYKSAVPSAKLTTQAGSDLLTNGDAAATGRPNIGWEPDKAFAEKDAKGKPVLYTSKKAGKDAGTPALINHSNVLPVSRSGRATIAGAVHTMELSLIGLRNLSFPEAGRVTSTNARDELAWTALAALALVAMTQRLRGGYHLRSGCTLVACKSPKFEVLGNSLEDTNILEIDAEGALALLDEAVAALRAANMPWGFAEGVELTPSPQLIEVIHLSLGQADDATTDDAADVP